MEITLSGNNIDQVVKKLGRLQRTRHENYPLPQLAMEVAEAAAAKEIDEDSADEVYGAYIQESTGQKPNPALMTFRVNSSKLRQIIKSKSPRLLQRVKKVHDSYRGKNIRPLYPAMVDACRLHLETGRMPTDHQLERIVSRTRYDRR